MYRSIALGALALSVSAGVFRASAEDWTQWRGKDRLAIWNEEGILDHFPEQGIEPIWKIDIGAGYSGPVVSDGKVITMDYFPKPGTETAEGVGPS